MSRLNWWVIVVVCILVTLGVVLAVVLTSSTSSTCLTTSSLLHTPLPTLTTSLDTTVAVDIHAPLSHVRGVPLKETMSNTISVPVRIPYKDASADAFPTINSPPKLGEPELSTRLPVSNTTLLSSAPPESLTYRPVYSSSIPDQVVSLNWDEHTQVLTLGAPLADRGYGRVYVYQLHPELVVAPQAEDRELALRLVRSVPFSMGGTVQQRAGYRVCHDIVVAPYATANKTSADVVGALFYVSSYSNTIKRLNIYCHDQFRLSDKGDIFRRTGNSLILSKRKGLRECRVDMFEFSSLEPTQPKLQSSILDSLSAPDFGHNILWHPTRAQVGLTSPSQGKLQVFEQEPVTKQWQVSYVWDYTHLPDYDQAEISLWLKQNLLVVSTPTTTYLLEYGTWRLVDTILGASQHKICAQRLLTWHSTSLQVYQGSTLVTEQPILDVAILTDVDMAVVTETSQLIWFHAAQ